LIFGVVDFGATLISTIPLLSTPSLLRKGDQMIDQAAELSQPDEEILTYTVSDEALEAAAGMERRGEIVTVTCLWTWHQCWAGC
jgi:hypothetical protein